jgi:hypothetical protein
MIQLKYQSPQIGKMHPGDVSKWSKALLMKIHVITGWVIPTNDNLIILIDQFEKKLVEDYSSLNPDEIEYAFRSTGTTVEDWGKSMNLNLIDRVLLPYLRSRIALSEIEEKQVYKPQQRIYSDDEILNHHREETQYCFQRYLKGDLTYFPIALMYQVLLRDELIIEGQDVGEFFQSLAEKKVTTIYVKE